MFTCLDDLGYVELGKEYLAVFHNLHQHMHGVKDNQLSEDTDMGILMSKSLFKEQDEVCEVSKIRLVGNNFSLSTNSNVL